MTFGSLLALFGFGLLVAKVVVTKKVSNMSMKTLQAYALVFAARLSSILFYEGYLPFDRSGDWYYQAQEGAALALALGLLAAMGFVYPRSYARAQDRFGVPGVIPNEAGVLVLVLPALALAAVLHPSLNNNWYTDTAWAFALYLEAIAIYPQLYMFYAPAPGSGAGAEIEPFELNFVFALAVGRLCHFVFWLSSYQELNDRASADFGKKFPGHLVVLSQVRAGVARGAPGARRGRGARLFIPRPPSPPTPADC